MAAVAGLALPLADLGAAEGLGLRPAEKRSQATSASAVDVRLSEKGVLAGRMVDGDGRPVARRSVIVLRGGRRVGSAETGPNGSFEVAQLHGGVHQLVAGGVPYRVRLWTSNAAPPAALARLVLVHAGDTVRGQLEPGPVGRGYERVKYWLADPLIVAGIVTAAVAIPVVVHNANIDRDSGS